MTNEEQIKNKSGKALATFFAKRGCPFDRYDEYGEQKCPPERLTEIYFDCIECWLSWLNKEE